MLKVLGLNLIMDAIVLFMICYYEIKDDGDASLKALLTLWCLWVILFGFITTGIYLLFL